ncbi:MAG: alpha/beta hydrolase family protein, partial [Thermoanaerobaculia bacterium]
IEAWVQKPPDYQSGKRYPMILNIHGGPHAAYGYTFDHEFQWMAAKGYVVLYPNPRGSTTVLKVAPPPSAALFDANPWMS